MLGIPFVLFGALLLGAHPTAPKCTPAQFGDWFAAAAEGDLELPEAVQERARRFRYVFVEGFCNERMPGYFAQNIKELRARGIARTAIHTISPSSHRTIDENFDEVRDRFLEIGREGPERLVVIAHSRGACDALAFALRNEEFVRDRVQALFLVQGAFGGTGVADYVTGEGPAMDRQMALRHRAVAQLLSRVERRALKRGKHSGLRDLTREASQDFWEEMVEEYADAIPVVGPRTFYVTSETRPSQLRLFRRATAWYLHTYFGPNDGLVAVCDQALPDLGTVLEVDDAGHGDLTNRSASTRATRPLRKALILSILMVVGQSRPDAEPVAEGR